MVGVVAAEFIAALAKFGGSLAEKALDLALDPAFNEALSPSTGLTVSPLMFNSTEQEGRWKLADWGYNPERLLSNRILAAATKSPVPNPADAPVNFYPSVATGAATQRAFGRLLTVNIAKPPDAYDFLAVALGTLTGGSTGPLYQLAKRTILQEGYAEISADWQHDGFEVWGGFAGLTSAKGFGSVFGHRANVQLHGTVYGNYLPASYLIGMSGFINPVGPNYVEFRCAAVVQAGKPIQALWGQKWDRDTGRQTDLKFSERLGFDLSVTP